MPPITSREDFAYERDPHYMQEIGREMYAEATAIFDTFHNSPAVGVYEVDAKSYQVTIDHADNVVDEPSLEVDIIHMGDHIMMSVVKLQVFESGRFLVNGDTLLPRHDPEKVIDNVLQTLQVAFDKD